MSQGRLPRRGDAGNAQAMTRARWSRYRQGIWLLSGLIGLFFVMYSLSTWRTEELHMRDHLNGTAEAEGHALSIYLQRHEDDLRYLSKEIADANGRLLPEAQITAALLYEHDAGLTIELRVPLTGTLIASKHEAMAAS